MSLDVPKFRTAYDGLQPKFSDLTSIECAEGSSLTHQSFRDDCDINRIIDRLDHQGFLDGNAPTKTPQFFDCTQFGDFHDAQNVVAQAKSAFELLPANVRFRFKNDPAEFVAFFDNPANAEEAITLGLATKRPEAPLEPQIAATGHQGSPQAKSSKKPVSDALKGEKGDD